MSRTIRVGGELPGRVDPLRFLQEVDSRQLEGPDGICFLPEQLARHVDETAVLFEVCLELTDGPAEHAAQRRCRQARVVDLVRVGVDTGRLDGERQLPAVPVIDGAALGVERDGSKALVEGLVFERLSVHTLDEHELDPDRQPCNEKEGPDEHEPNVLGAPPFAPHGLVLRPVRDATTGCSAQPGHPAPTVASSGAESLATSSPGSSAGSGMGA